MSQGPSAFSVVSIIIPVFRDGARLRRCLAALSAQTYPADRLEIIVADNGSPDESRAVAAEFPRVVFVTEPSGGSYAARNAALAVATGSLMAFTDSDCVPDCGWVAAGVKALAADDRLGLVAGRVNVVAVEPRRPNIWEALDSVSAFPQELFVKQGFGATANLFSRMCVARDVGFFRAEMLSSGDVEWGRRVTAAGWRAAYSDDAFVHHPARNSWRDFSRRMRRHHHGYRDNHWDFAWYKILLGRHPSVRLPRNLLLRADIPWGVRWRAMLASVPVRLLDRWVKILVRVLGRPTLRQQSIKGW